jgi:hypothetical protein
MKNNNFKLSRLARQMRNELILNVTSSRLCLAAMLIVSYFTFACFFSRTGLDNYPLFFYLIGLAFSAQLFNVFRNKEKTIAWLTLPCSNAERLWSKWLLIMFAYPVAILILFSLSRLLANLIQFILFHSIPPIPTFVEIIGNQFSSLLIHYFILQAIVILGFMTFRNVVLIKTALTTLLLGVSFFLSLLFVLRVTGFRSLTNGYCLSQNINKYAEALQLYGNSLYILSVTLFIIFCTYVAWLKLTEYEVS